jgi:hypothetical protein
MRMDVTERQKSTMPISRRGFLCLLLLAASGAGGCQTFRFTTVQPNPGPGPENAADLPNKKQQRVSQYVFHADFEINPKLPLFQDLANLREQVYKELHLPASTNLVQVYLFENDQRYERFMHAHYPELPKRRAFFVAQPLGFGGREDLLVFTWWGENLSQDLRHELTHALLHSVLKDVPLWLDEGLAEFFELPPANRGVNLKHLEHLRQADFRPDLARLEQLTEVQQMTPAEYREAWAWVHLMLRSSPEAHRVLMAYLGELRTNSRPGPLRPRLAAVLPATEEALARHVADLERAGQRPVAAQR